MDNNNSEPEEKKEENLKDEEEVEAKSTVHTRIQKVLSATGGPGYSLGRLLMDSAGQTQLKSTGSRPTPAPRNLSKKISDAGPVTESEKPSSRESQSPPSKWTCSRCAFDDNTAEDKHCRLCSRGHQ